MTSLLSSPQQDKQAAHDAAWDRFHAAERAIKQGDHSPAAQQEYKNAVKHLDAVRKQNAGGVFASLRLGGAR
jgi:hypothetical protein